METSYNVDGKPVLEIGEGPDGKDRVTRSWEYDTAGNLKKAVAGGICYTYEYRADGKMLKKSSSGRTLLSCTYFPDGKLESLTDVSGKTVHYHYGWKGELTAVTDEKGDRIASYSHTPGGHLKEILHGNGLRTQYAYDTDGNIIRLRLERENGETISDLRYEYDLKGNRTLKAGSSFTPEGSLAELAVSYHYDQMDRLISENRDGEDTSYLYDLCGNRLKKLDKNGKEEYNYNRKNQLISRKRGGQRVVYQYDMQGNLLKAAGAEGTTSYTYNAFNQQTAVLTADGGKLENQYDAEYLRAGTIENGEKRTFLYYQGELIAEADKSEEPISRYILGYGVAAGWNQGREGYYSYHLDEQNSTAYILGAGGEIENVYQYDAFGVIKKSQERIQNRILYTGQQYDRISEQYYLRARYYNPVVGRFLQEDVYRGDGLNLYTYCKDNPVVYYDPSGYTSRKERKSITDSNGYLMGDENYSGKLPSNSWKLVEAGDGAHLYEKGNIEKRSIFSIFRQDDLTPTYYPYGSIANAGQAHLRLHDATAEVGIKVSRGNPNLSDTQLVELYQKAYSIQELQNIKGDLRVGDKSVIIGTDLTPQEAFEKLNEWGKKNDPAFKQFYEQQIETKGNKNVSNEDGKC